MNSLRAQWMLPEFSEIFHNSENIFIRFVYFSFSLSLSSFLGEEKKNWQDLHTVGVVGHENSKS